MERNGNDIPPDRLLRGRHAVPVDVKPRRTITDVSVRGRVRQGAKKVLRWIDLAGLPRADREAIRAAAELIMQRIDQGR